MKRFRTLNLLFILFIFLINFSTISSQWTWPLLLFGGDLGELFFEPVERGDRSPQERRFFNKLFKGSGRSWNNRGGGWLWNNHFARDWGSFGKRNFNGRFQNEKNKVPFTGKMSNLDINEIKPKNAEVNKISKTSVVSKIIKKVKTTNEITPKGQTVSNKTPTQPTRLGSRKTIKNVVVGKKNFESSKNKQIKSLGSRRRTIADFMEVDQIGNNLNRFGIYSKLSSMDTSSNKLSSGVEKGGVTRYIGSESRNRTGSGNGNTKTKNVVSKEGGRIGVHSKLSSIDASSNKLSSGKEKGSVARDAGSGNRARTPAEESGRQKGKGAWIDAGGIQNGKLGVRNGGGKSQIMTGGGRQEKQQLKGKGKITNKNKSTNNIFEKRNPAFVDKRTKSKQEFIMKSQTVQNAIEKTQFKPSVNNRRNKFIVNSFAKDGKAKTFSGKRKIIDWYRRSGKQTNRLVSKNSNKISGSLNQNTIQTNFVKTNYFENNAVVQPNPTSKITHAPKLSTTTQTSTTSTTTESTTELPDHDVTPVGQQLGRNQIDYSENEAAGYGRGNGFSFSTFLGNLFGWNSSPGLINGVGTWQNGFGGGPTTGSTTGGNWFDPVNDWKIAAREDAAELASDKEGVWKAVNATKEGPVDQMCPVYNITYQDNAVIIETQGDKCMVVIQWHERVQNGQAAANTENYWGVNRFNAYKTVYEPVVAYVNQQ